MYGAQDDLDGLDLNQFEYDERHGTNRRPVVNYIDDNVYLQSNSMYDSRYLNRGYEDPTGFNRQTSFMSNASRRDHRRDDPNYDYRRNVSYGYNPRDEIYDQDQPTSRYFQEEEEYNSYYPNENIRRGYEDYPRGSFHPRDDHRRRFEDHHQSWDPAREQEYLRHRSRYDTSPPDTYRYNDERQHSQGSNRDGTMRASQKKRNVPNSSKKSHDPVKKNYALEKMPYIPPPDYDGTSKLSYVPRPDY